MQQLQRYHWPGNIRELQNVIERAVILARGGVLQFDPRLPFHLTTTTHPRATDERASTPAAIIREEKWKERECDNILAALKQTRGKIYGAGGAAELLGIKPTTLAYRVKVLGIAKSNKW